MGIKEAWNELVGKKEKTALSTAVNEANLQQLADLDLFPIVKMPETSLKKYNKIPVSGLAALGSAFSQLPVNARTIMQTKTTMTDTTEPLYRAINPKGIVGVWAQGDYGLNGNIMQVNDQGKNVIKGRLQFEKVTNTPITENVSTTIPFDPTLMVVAVAVMAIDQKLDAIQESVENVFQFMELDKQSVQRGNLKKLAEIAEDYKIYCKDKDFCANRNQLVQSIQTKALQDVEFYKERISTQLDKQKDLHFSKDADSVMNGVVHEFAEYQLSCYLYAYCAFMDTMLRQDFSTDHIVRCRERMQALSNEYTVLYLNCCKQIEKYHHTSIDSKIVDGVGFAVKGLGKTIGAIPVIKDGKLDETLIEAGKKIDNKQTQKIMDKLDFVKTCEDNHMKVFEENLSTVDLMFNGENTMLTDGENVYVLQAE